MSAESRKSLEDRSYLLLLLALLLLGLNFASWPLFYSMLQSYVPEWRGVMCIYGVTRIGIGSVGASRFLPGVLSILQVTKPALVFLSGVWFVLYLVNRRTRTAPLMSRVLLVLMALGAFTVFDSACEAAYLVIPKKEVFLHGGCCTGSHAGSGASTLLPDLLRHNDRRGWLYGAFYGINGAIVLALLVQALFARRLQVRRWLPPLFFGALISIPVSTVFLIEVASPALLRLPFHQCPYDLISKAPESVVSVALFLLGCFSIGWACTAGWFADCPETSPFLRNFVNQVLFLALFGYLASVVMLSIELGLV